MGDADLASPGGDRLSCKHPVGGAQMTKRVIRTDKAPKSLAACSQGMKAGGPVFVADQGPSDPVTGEVVGTTIQEQTRFARNGANS